MRRSAETSFLILDLFDLPLAFAEVYGFWKELELLAYLASGRICTISDTTQSLFFIILLLKLRVILAYLKISSS